MKNKLENQALDADDLEILEKEIQSIERDKLMLEKNIAIKQEFGYFEKASYNAAADQWRKTFAADYAKSRRKKREAEAKEEGRVLRAYEPATPERRLGQLRAAKVKARLDPAYVEAERVKNTTARALKRAEMTEAERTEANRVRREKRAAKKATPSAT